MSLQFILGNSGSGKSHYLYQQIVNESMEHPEKNYLVLVPEQFTMQTQRDLCAAHPRGGIMNIDALSFMRLAYRVFEEVGREEQPVLDDEGKNLVIRRIAGKLEDDLKVLKGNLKKQGYISEVKSVISEFVQYGLDTVKMNGEGFTGHVKAGDKISVKYMKDLKSICGIVILPKKRCWMYWRERYVTQNFLRGA